MRDSLQAPHTILEYLITKAAVSGKVSSSTVRIPFADLAASVGKDQQHDSELVIEINLSWDRSPETEKE